MAAQVMIEFVPDTSQVKTALEDIESNGGEVEGFKQGNAELEKRNKILSQGVALQEKADQTDKKRIATLNDVGKATGRVATEVIKITGSDFAKAMQEQGKSAEELINHLGDLGDQAGKTGQATQSLRAQQRALREEIALLIATGRQESQQFRDLVARAGELDDAMGDANDAIRRTGSDTQGLDNALIAARGVAAGFSVLTSTMALFGDESEEVQQLLLKVNAAMALLNGLQEIQNILRSEYVRSLIASIAAQRTNNANIAIENGLQSTSVVVRTAATAAQWALNTAMLANPIGIVAAALAILVTGLIAFISASEDATEKQIAFNNAMTAADIDAEREAIERFTRVQIASAKARGASEKELTAIANAAAKSRVALTKEELTKVNKLLTDNEALRQSGNFMNKIFGDRRLLDEKELEQLKERAKSLNKTLQDLETDAIVTRIDGEKAVQDEQAATAAKQKQATDAQIKENQRLAEERKKAAKKAEEDRVKAFEKVKDDEEKLQLETAAIRRGFELDDREEAQKKIDANKAALNQQGLDAMAKAREVAKFQQDLDNETFERQKKEREALNRAIAQASIQALGQIASAAFQISAARREEELNAQLDQLNQQKEAALSAENLTAKDKANIQKRYDKEIGRIKQEAARKQRKADIAEAIVNTALAVVNALASAPWPYNVIAAAAAGVAGGVQVAKIASTPLPQYAKGGRNVPAGFALVGEEGPEIVRLNGGEDIITASASEKMMRDWALADRTALLARGTDGSSGIDYEQLGRAVARHLPAQPNISMVADEQGLTMYLETQQYRRTIRNKRYSFR